MGIKNNQFLIKGLINTYFIRKGSNFSTKIEKAPTELTPEMISSGSWKTTSLKPYNLDSLGQDTGAGCLHPLLKVRAEYRQIFLEMGFSEMPANNFVESSFWNFDALFQPQQHPARDAHDTFFISDPATSDRLQKIVGRDGLRTGKLGGHPRWKNLRAQKNLFLNSGNKDLKTYLTSGFKKFRGGNI